MQQVWHANDLLLDMTKMPNKSAKMSRNVAAVIGQGFRMAKISNESFTMGTIIS